MSNLSLRLVAASGIALFLIGPAGALAADLPPPPPPPEIRADWTGPYIGGALAVTCLEMEYIPAGAPDPDLNGCGLAGGFLGGWNYQMSNVVFGIEGDYMWGGHNASNDSDGVEYDLDDLATIRGRVGWLHSDTLFYGTAGVGWLGGTMHVLAGDSNTHFGWLVGGGIEHAFTPNLHARLEYLYGNFDTEDYNIACGCTASLDIEQLHMVRAAVTWNFGSILW